MRGLAGWNGCRWCSNCTQLAPCVISCKLENMRELHGHNGKNRLYRIWVAMRQRCAKPYRDGYATYGARGITVCREWDTSFIAFKAWADSAGYMDDLSIDRINPNGNYEPSNCRWATPQEQGDNKRNSCYVEVDGVSKTVAAWAHEYGFHLTTLYRRYRQGIRGKEFLKPSVKKPKPISVDDIQSGRAADIALMK